MNNKLYIGIDLHKRVQTWVVLGERDNIKLLTRTYPVTPEDITRAVTDLRRLGKSHTTYSVLIEPVCGWIWVVKQLRDLGLEVQITNPRKIRMIAESLNKTDEGDAYILARLLKTGEVALSYECGEETRKHRSLSRERCFLVNTRASLKTRLESIVTRDGNHAFSPSVRNRTKISVPNNEVKIHQDAIHSMDLIIKTLEQEITDTIQLSPEINRLMTIPGVGMVTASTIVAEVGDFKNFKKPENLASFSGLTPRERSSGGKQRLGSITHAGSPYLRYVLIETAMRIRDTEQTASLYAFYKRIKTKTGGAMKARVALARKILTIMWHMMNKQQNYVAY